MQWCWWVFQTRIFLLLSRHPHIVFQNWHLVKNWKSTLKWMPQHFVQTKIMNQTPGTAIDHSCCSPLAPRQDVGEGRVDKSGLEAGRASCNVCAFWKILSTQNNCPRPMTCISKNIINLKIFVNVLHRARWKILTIWKYLPTSYIVHVDKYHICSDLLILVLVFTRQSSSAPRWELRLNDLSATCHSKI